MSTPIEQLIEKDLETFLSVLSEKKELTSENVVELSAYIAANFMRIIYTKQKSISKEEINGVIGIISNLLNDWFQGEITNDEYQEISKKSLSLLQDTGFDEKSQLFFRNLLADNK